MDKMRFTQGRVEQIPFSSQRKEYQDENTNYLVLRVGARQKTWYYLRKINNKSTRTKIGPFPEISLREAREIAAEYSGNVARTGSIDTPGKPRRITFSDAFDYYVKSKGGEISASLQSLWNGYMSLLGSSELNSLSREDFRKLHKDIGEPDPKIKDANGKPIKGKKTTANRVIKYSRSVINIVITDGLFDGINPASNIKLYKEEPRDRYLFPDEMDSFLEQLKKFEDKKKYAIQVAAIKVLLLTGQRKGNVLAMRWDQLDLTHQIWTIPAEEFKGRRTHRVALSDTVTEILQNLYDSKGSSDWVFPRIRNNAACPHLMDIRKTLAAILEAAEIKKLTVHDLRRTFGSWLAADGVPMHIISRLLGHADTRITEKVYAHIDLEPLKKAADSFSRKL